MNSKNNVHSNGVLIEGKNIRRVFKTGKKNLDVLKGIDITIRKGLLYTLVGPSGVGKSTLLHILGGLDRPTEGEVILNNKNLYDFPDNKLAKIRNKEIGFIFQFHHLLPEFSALENVFIPSIINGGTIKRARLRAKDLLVKFGLGNRFDHKPNELSGGEKQRVAVARALINNPSVILADEPTGNLDRENSELLLSKFLELNRCDGITIVVVTHNEDLALQFSNIIRLVDGRILGEENAL